MNNFYCNVGKNLSKQIQQPNEKHKEIGSNLKSIFLIPTNALEVMNIIKQLKNKSGGVDKINARTLKALDIYIGLPLTHILNLSIEKSVWPEALRSAELIPIYKAGNKSNITNYRPISLISNFATKIFAIIF